MRTLTTVEVDLICGGVCETKTLVECIDGIGMKAADEIEAFASRASRWWDSWCEYNDAGIWLYNTIHGC